MRLQYVEKAVRIYPTAQRQVIEPRVPDAEVPVGGSRRCRLCSQPAVFMIPDGMTCDEHAWQAAARTNWDDADPWVPIRIDRSNAT